MDSKNCPCPVKKSDAVYNLSKIWYPPTHICQEVKEYLSIFVNFVQIMYRMAHTYISSFCGTFSSLVVSQTTRPSPTQILNMCLLYSKISFAFFLASSSLKEGSAERKCCISFSISAVSLLLSPSLFPRTIPLFSASYAISCISISYFMKSLLISGLRFAFSTLASTCRPKSVLGFSPSISLKKSSKPPGKSVSKAEDARIRNGVFRPNELF